MSELPSVARHAGDLFESGLNCTESLLVAFAESQGVNCPAFPRLATGFCAGVSRTCGTCGAVSGGVMAIGMKLGRNSATDTVDECYAAVQQFKAAFTSRFGTDNCMELIDCDLSTNEGREAFQQRNLRPQCREYVEVVAELVVETVGE
jgi:C_GCAxxG_C_C family probable redox protein